MDEFSIVKAPTPPNGNESLRINKAAGNIRGYVSFLKFKDKDTNQIITFCPSLDISGYGESDKKAIDMIVVSIRNYFNQLVLLSPNAIEAELNFFGWKLDKFGSKEYYKAYLDNKGNLNDFNAVDDKVEQLAIQAI